MSYTHLAYLKPGQILNLETLKNNITSRYSSIKNNTPPTITEEANMIKIALNKNYNFYITLVTASHVATEARETAEQLEKDWAGESYDKEELKQATARLDFYGDDDTDMEYFNDSLFILEEIEKLGNTIIFHTN